MAKKTPGTILITGANGFLGGHLVTHFAGKGWQVIGLVRDPSAQTPHSNATYAPYDLRKPFDASLCKGVDVVVHTAYVKQESSDSDAMNINVQAAEALVSAAHHHGVKKCIFMSSMSAHDDAISVYGKQKLAIEQLFSGPGGAVLRAGLIVGDGGLVKQMMEFVQTKRIVPLVGGGMQPLQIIAVYDLVRAIDALITKNLHGTFVTATPTVYTYKDFYRAIGDRLGIKLIFVPVPFFVLQTALKLASLLHVTLSVNEDNLLGLKKLRTMESAADLKKIGVTLDSLDEALVNTPTP